MSAGDNRICKMTKRKHLQRKYESMAEVRWMQMMCKTADESDNDDDGDK